MDKFVTPPSAYLSAKELGSLKRLTYECLLEVFSVWVAAVTTSYSPVWEENIKKCQSLVPVACGELLRAGTSTPSLDKGTEVLVFFLSSSRTRLLET